MLKQSGFCLDLMENVKKIWERKQHLVNWGGVPDVPNNEVTNHSYSRNR
jgi:hypothetical protein